MLPGVGGEGEKKGVLGCETHAPWAGKAHSPTWGGRGRPEMGERQVEEVAECGEQALLPASLIIPLRFMSSSWTQHIPLTKSSSLGSFGADS